MYCNQCYITCATIAKLKGIPIDEMMLREYATKYCATRHSIPKYSSNKKVYGNLSKSPPDLYVK